VLQPATQLRFGPVIADTSRRLLRRHGQLVHLAPKTWDLLEALLRAPGVVTKTELLDRLWPAERGSEYAMSRTVRRLREALGDDARQPRYVRTVHGTGFEWIAAVEADSAAPAHELVGCETQMSALSAAFAATADGVPRLVLVEGVAGSGKTAMVRQFVASLAHTADVMSAACHDTMSGAEPGRPILDALDRAVTVDPAAVTASLRRHAPTWLAELPRRLDPDERAPGAVSVSTTRPQLLRELVHFLGDRCARHPLVFVVDDVHWADPTTLDALESLLVTTDPSHPGGCPRLLIIATHRPVSSHRTGDVFAAWLRRIAGRATTVKMAELSEQHIAILAADRLGTDLPVRTVEQIARWSGGNPMHVLAVLDQVSISPDGEELDPGLYMATLPRIVDEQLDLLPVDTIHLLEVASLARAAFGPDLIAAVAGVPVESVADRFELLADTTPYLVRHDDSRYDFGHDNFRGAAAARVGRARAVGIHRRLGQQLAPWAETGQASPTDVAEHLLLGGMPDAALPFLLRAGWDARRRFAHAEALELFDLAVEAHQSAPAGSVRPAAELEARLGLALSQLFLRSRQRADTLQNIQALNELVESMGDAPELFTAWQSVLLVNNLAGRTDRVQAMAGPLLRMAQARGRVHELMDGHHAAGEAALHAGRPAQALAEFDVAAEFLDQARSTNATPTSGQQIWARDSGARILVAQAGCALLIGDADRVHTCVDAALALMAEGDCTPLVRVGNLSIIAATLWLLGDVDGARGAAESALELADDENEDFRAMASVVHAATGAPTTVAAARSIAAVLLDRPTIPYPLGLTVFASSELLPADEMLDVLEEIVAAVDRAGTRWADAELQRVRGALILSTADGEDAEARAEAVQCFDQALAIAQAQGARFWADRVRRSRRAIPLA
jgi:DNA-binding winged helix-turn-helix (wHTH) protein/tetratricopeptide (TPR) repeat protein